MATPTEAVVQAAAPMTLGPPKRDYSHERLSMPLQLRLPVYLLVSGFAGFVLGLSHGGTEYGMRFRAENAHRLPTTQAGWFLYHKSKNYHMMLGGIKEGLKMSARVAFWTGLFVGAEEGIDRARAGVVRHWRGLRGAEGEEKAMAGNRDCVSTMLAGLGTAGVFSAWNRFPVPTAARVAKMGAKAGLAFGVVQDAVGLVRGRRLGYVEFVKRQAGFTVGEADRKASVTADEGLPA